jgi:hypothetical protein
MNAAPFPTFDENAAAIAENGYDVLPLPRGQKRAVLKDWTNYQFQETDLCKYRGWGIGLLTRRTPVIDADVKHARAAAEIEALVEAEFGPAPRRVGAAPKAAWVLQLEGPAFAKLQTCGYRFPGDAPGDKAHKVEILADGQQLVAYNIHPDTHKPYVWNGAGEPLRTPVGLLPPLTHEQAREFIVKAEAILAYHGTPVGESANGQANGHDAGAKQGPGSRNSTLTKLAGSMRRAGFSAAAIGDALHKENLERYEPPLPGAEVNAICEQAGKWQQGESDGTDSSDWPEPVNILHELSAPAFTAEDLPAVLAQYPAAYAQATGFDPSLPLSGAISVAAAALSDGFQIVGDSSSEWFTQARLWILAIARPGTGKTPAHKAMLAPLWAIDGALREAHAQALAAKTKDDPVPPKPRVIVTDTTIEALARWNRHWKHTSRHKPSATRPGRAIPRRVGRHRDHQARTRIRHRQSTLRDDSLSLSQMRQLFALFDGDARGQYRLRSPRP